MSELKILVLDDEAVIRQEISEFLSDEGFVTYEADRPSKGLDIINNTEIDIVILDIQLPEMNGLEVLQKIKEIDTEIEVIMITGHGDMEAVIKAMRYGASEFFPKPFRLNDLQRAIERTSRFVNLSQKVKELSSSYSYLSKEVYDYFGHELIGKSEAMKNVITLVGKVAKSDFTSVMITGESGVGKEIVARGIHYLSQRKNNYFYPVNCSAIPDTLFESEFFGHKKGTFTGANEDKAGWFEIAHHGTLFLDEIVDMDHNMQAKLLRVLEDRNVRRIGSHKDVEVDVRIISATNKDVQQLIDENKFRADLFYRINSFTIYIPPLRERREDIPLLLEQFVKFFSARMNKPIKSIDKNIVKLLNNYNFPGNVRELRNMVEKAMILCDDGKLRPVDFQLPGTSQPIAQSESKDQDYVSFDLEENERKLISKVLELTNYKKSDAAEMLNITRQSLDRRIQKFDL